MKYFCFCFRLFRLILIVDAGLFSHTELYENPNKITFEETLDFLKSLRHLELEKWEKETRAPEAEFRKSRCGLLDNFYDKLVEYEQIADQINQNQGG